MKTSIETLKKMQAIELEAGFPNGELWNELQDKIISIEMEEKIEKTVFKSSSKLFFELEGKSSAIHY